ncbi:hypothetical protein C2E20_2477 [Micractinium conductrix]|uniref:Uncharacterized protein n=1 Tax=Micractinium conductrix TaxID=554055 RepID=A0A2P6VK23_9CHLO|nr:hypothetical protein C2E20_2477 [Micractinium conductrix]|eukprot:PSC74417.1 hypothetical protein C2E20_2477 [Micractinium conductrix]
MEEEEEAPPPPPPAAEPTTAGAGGADDQVAAALRKISSHIGSPKKFAKASQLLRELLAQGAVRQAHGPLLFSALKAAMGDPAQCGDPLLAREYSKLFTAASKAAELFTTREKTQLDVYGTWAVLRNQLATDDSFQFNKVVTQLKAMVGELPEAEEAAEGVVAGLAAAAGAPDPVLQAYDARQQGGQQAQAQQQQQQAQQQAATSAEEAEADPFGLDALIEQQEEEERRAREAAAAARAQVGPKSATWSAAEVVSQRRAALLDCLDAAKACYRHAWARTSVDLLIEHCHQHTHRFAPSQAERLSELMSFVRDQRRLRKLGPSAREVNRDSTSFERASADWSRATVSHRGKVGGGDHKSEAWLG